MTANKGVFDTLRAPLLDVTFSDAPPISTSGGQTPGAVTADIGGDGDQDIIAAEYGADTVALYESNGTSPPTWTKRVIDVAAQGPITVATGDLDGDSDTDVVSANFNLEGVAWYENKGGSPPAWTKRLISGMPGAWGVHVADVDGDGDLDAVGGNRFDPGDHIGVEWYENNGGAPPAFTIHRVSAGFVDAASVHAADLDGDGDGDILAVDVFRDTILLYENDGGHPPAWTERVLTNATNDPWSVFAADVDGDGDLDVLSASAEDDTIAWYQNAGGTPLVFTRRVIAASAEQAIAVHAADLDGDADVDVVSGAWSNEIAWYESDGGATPSFTRHVVSSNCKGPEGVFAARLDPDRDLDILAACNILGEIQWFPNFDNFTDADLDGVRDTLDCAPGNASAFAVPREVRDVRFPDATLLAWSSERPRSGAGTRYDVLRGDIDDLPVGSGLEVCLADGTSGETTPETAVPARGRGFVYFVRAGNGCGTGPYGATSQAVERISTPCP
jgi:hypothetical protein